MSYNLRSRRLFCVGNESSPVSDKYAGRCNELNNSVSNLSTSTREMKNINGNIFYGPVNKIFESSLDDHNGISQACATQFQVSDGNTEQIIAPGRHISCISTSNHSVNCLVEAFPFLRISEQDTDMQDGVVIENKVVVLNGQRLHNSESSNSSGVQSSKNKVEFHSSQKRDPSKYNCDKKTVEEKSQIRRSERLKNCVQINSEIDIRATSLDICVGVGKKTPAESQKTTSIRRSRRLQMLLNGASGVHIQSEHNNLNSNSPNDNVLEVTLKKRDRNKKDRQTNCSNNADNNQGNSDTSGAHLMMNGNINNNVNIRILHTCIFCQRKVHDMKKHIKMHSSKGITICMYCKKEFSSLYSLRMHILTHTGEKPFRCPVCWKAFSQRSTVNNHILIHTGEKPYCCDTCKKYFRERSHLKRHILIHTGEKPYRCVNCDRAFNQSGSLKLHLKKRHSLD